MAEQVQTVVAGSKAFVDALDAHLRLRFGTAPLLARSPIEAMKACAGEGGLLVLEYAGPDWLEAVKGVRAVRDRATLPIVAAVPSSRMAELSALQRAGVDETVRWDARIDPVLWAVDRLVAGRPRRPSAPDAPPRAAAAPEEGDLEQREGPAVGPAPAAESLPPLPAELPADEEIVKLLRAALSRGPSPDEGWRLFTERVGSQLGDMERVALSGAPFPLDAAPLRAAACLRWRIAAVLERARQTGSPPAPDVASELPIEVDAALSALKALAGSAGADLQPGVEAARNALVREAIGFTDAVAAALTPAAAQPAAPPVAERPAARLVINESADQSTISTTTKSWWIALALVLALAATYHGWRIATRPAPKPLPTMAGAPAGTYVVHSGQSLVLKSLAGKTASAAELEAFRAQEQAKGNVVREIAPGTWVVEPAPAPGGGGSKP